jgi:glycosyltransferase involved in cell wall biosynthesis
MPSLLILTQYYPPEMGAPQVRLSELASRLRGRGWEVEVLTALPNYPQGRILDGYPKLRPKVEEVSGVRTVRVPLLPSKGGFVARLVCYLSFVASAALLGPRLCQRPDLLLVESPPLFLGWAGRWLSWRFGAPYVLNVSDLWPESAIRLGVVARGSLAARLAERLERSLYRHAAGLAGQSSEIVDHLAERAPGVPVELVTNGVDPDRFGPHRKTPEAAELLGNESGPVFLYAGLLGHAQGLDRVLDLAASLAPEIPGRIVLVGGGPREEHLARRVATEGITRVRLVQAQPRERVPELLAAADAALVPLWVELPGAVPSKIYEAMASGLPILLLAGGEPARRVEEAGAGLAVPLDDEAAARDAFRRLATDRDLARRLGEAGRRTAETVYHRDQIAARLDRFLRGLLESPR